MIRIPKLPFVSSPPNDSKVQRERQDTWNSSSSTLVGPTHAKPGRANDRKNFFLKHLPAEAPQVDDPVASQLRETQFDAVTALLKEGPKTNRFSVAAEYELEQLKRELEPADKKNIHQFRKKLINLLAANMLPANMPAAKAKKCATTLFKQAMIDHHNGESWQPIKRSFINDEHLYSSRLIPAGQMKHNGCNIFERDYQDKGVCSGTSTCTEHATNLWISEFSAAPAQKLLTDIPLFKGVRHGTLSPYGVKPGPNRARGALTRAREVATAALFLQPEKFEAALSGQEVELKLTSTSLLTAFNIAGETEGKQLADQLNAWKKLCADNPVTLKIGAGENRPPKEVKVRLAVAAFNFGVNEAALNLKLGWGDADKQNETGLKQLLGDQLQPEGEEGGWVKAYLEQKPAPSARDKKIVKELSAQIRQIWSNKSHHKDGGEPYKLAQRVALLSHQIGVVPCYNCKSGKDRTGMLDSELKREAVHLHRFGLPTPLGKDLDSDQQAVFRKVLACGGNLEIQEKNTGAPGNKVLKKFSKWGNNLSYRARIGDSQSFREARGMSGAVKS